MTNRYECDDGVYLEGEVAIPMSILESSILHSCISEHLLNQPGILFDIKCEPLRVEDGQIVFKVSGVDPDMSDCED